MGLEHVDSLEGLMVLVGIGIEHRRKMAGGGGGGGGGLEFVFGGQAVQ